MRKIGVGIQRELDAIRKKNGGILQCAKVVEFARDPKTALHGRFEWDDTAAAQEYRLWQARELIRVYVTVLASETEPVRAFVSLVSDRVKVGGGYRGIVEVMSDEGLREELLAEALAEAARWKEKWKRLKELVPIFVEIERATKKTRKRKTG